MTEQDISVIEEKIRVVDLQTFADARGLNTIVIAALRAWLRSQTIAARHATIGQWDYWLQAMLDWPIDV